jgi:Ca-activated chloride channel family protein
MLAQNKDESIRVDTNLVLINVLVRDKNGQLVRGLKAEQFEVLDNEAKRPIESFSADEASVSFGIIYDMHPTTDERTKSVIESLRQFKAEIGPGDDIFLVAFNMRGEQTFDFIPTFDQLGKHMTAPAKREPNSLYDAVYFASDRIQSSRNRKRVLLIVSDSSDHHSRHTFSEVREKVSDIRAEVYAVIFDENDGYGYSDITQKSRERYPFSKDASPLDRAAIVDLTLRSGGSVYFGPSKNAQRLFTIYGQNGRDMRSHYTLGFYPDDVDDKQHSIRIKLRGVQGAKDFVLTYQPSYRNLKRSFR